MRNKKFLSCVIAVILIISSVISVSAGSYVIDPYGSVFEVDGDTLIFSGYQGTYSKVEIPSVYSNKNVVGVAPFAMKDNTVMDHLSFEYAYNLQYIGDYAFMGCNNIQSVYLEKTDVSVGCGIFRECNALVYSEFYANNNVVPEELFYGCPNLERVKLSKSLVKICKYAFRECPKLEYLELPKTLTLIEDDAFKDSTNLVLGVWYNSYAYNYAVENNIPYVLIDGVKLGDANGDGVVSINDVTTIQRHLAELAELEGIYLHAADVNQDGEVTIDDATEIQLYLAEYELEYQIGEVITQ